MHCKQNMCVGTNHALLLNWARGIANTSQLFSKSKHSKCQLELQRTGAEAFILDLRSNPGGLVRSSLDVARIFLDGPTAVFNVTGRNGGELPAAAQVNDCLKNIPYLKFIWSYALLNSTSCFLGLQMSYYQWQNHKIT